MPMGKPTSRRDFLRLSALGATAALLAACNAPPAASVPTTVPGASGGLNPAGAAPAPTEAAATPVAGSKPSTQATTQLRVHDWLQDPDDKTYGPFIKQFEDKHPGVKVNREWFPRADMHTKELTLAATGQIGDVVRLNVAPTTAEMKNKDVIQALDSFIKADKQWSDNDHKQFWPGNIATYTIQGQQWGYPVVGHPGCLHWYYNLDHLKSVNAPLPPGDPDAKTFDTSKWKIENAINVITSAVKTGSDGRVAVYGIQPCLGGEGTVAVLRSFGGNYYNEDGTKCLINTPESIAGLQFLSDYWNKLKAAIPIDTNPDYQQTFPSQRTAIVILTAVAGTIKNLVGDKFKWSIAPPPIGPSGKLETQVSSDGIGISKITKQPELAWDYVKQYVGLDFGVIRHLAGLGSPGSRYDVWTDPRFKQGQPLLSTIIYDNLIDPKKAPPLRPWSYPSNGRYNETDTAMTNVLQDIWLGKKQPKEAADAAYTAVQEIMDKQPT